MKIRKSLKEKEEEKAKFNKFLKEFGIDKDAKCFPDSPFYIGTILTKEKVLEKLTTLGIIGKSFLGRLKGKIVILLHSSCFHCFKDPSSYYAGYWFELIDKNPDRYRLVWEDTTGGA